MHGEFVTHYTTKSGQRIFHGGIDNGSIRCIPVLDSNEKVKIFILTYACLMWLPIRLQQFFI
jgi:hypothetical protein